MFQHHLANGAAVVILILVVIGPLANGLHCWQCLAEDCQADPVNNHKAFKIEWYQEGSSCQVTVRLVR